jgi:hypothetical protein
MGVSALAVALKAQSRNVFYAVGYQLFERFPAKMFLPIVREFIVDAVTQLHSCEKRNTFNTENNSNATFLKFGVSLCGATIFLRDLSESGVIESRRCVTEICTLAQGGVGVQATSDAAGQGLASAADFKLELPKPHPSIE